MGTTPARSTVEATARSTRRRRRRTCLRASPRMKTQPLRPRSLRSPKKRERNRPSRSANASGCRLELAPKGKLTMPRTARLLAGLRSTPSMSLPATQPPQKLRWPKHARARRARGLHLQRVKRRKRALLLLLQLARLHHVKEELLLSQLQKKWTRRSGSQLPSRETLRRPDRFASSSG